MKCARVEFLLCAFIIRESEKIEVYQNSFLTTSVANLPAWP